MEQIILFTDNSGKSLEIKKVLEDKKIQFIEIFSRGNDIPTILPNNEQQSFRGYESCILYAHSLKKSKELK